MSVRRLNSLHVGFKGCFKKSVCLVNENKDQTGGCLRLYASNISV